VTDDRAELMLEILKKLQSDIALIRREQSSQAIRLLAMEDHQRGIITSLHGVLTSIHGVEVDVAHLKDRVERIEQRIGLMDTEH
jgi:predicted ATP-grasp superfamily ATP-dependent carboligase